MTVNVVAFPSYPNGDFGAAVRHVGTAITEQSHHRCGVAARCQGMLHGLATYR